MTQFTPENTLQQPQKITTTPKPPPETDQTNTTTILIIALIISATINIFNLGYTIGKYKNQTTKKA